MRQILADPANAYMSGLNVFAPAERKEPSNVFKALSSHGGPTVAAGNALAGGGDVGQQVLTGLINRGMPKHVAEAFVINMQDESGLNPSINEASPLVPGSRGGFGLYQLTGPRRKSYEAYAAKKGVPLGSVDAQLDFLMMELQGPESSAARSIFGAKTTGEAAAAIVNKFLRPAPEHRERRTRNYLRG